MGEPEDVDAMLEEALDKIEDVGVSVILFLWLWNIVKLVYGCGWNEAWKQVVRPKEK